MNVHGELSGTLAGPKGLQGQVASPQTLSGNLIPSFAELDPTVPAWAKEPNKPVYTAQEVGALPAGTTIPTKVSELNNDSGYLTSAVTSFNNQTGDVTFSALTDQEIDDAVDAAFT